MTLLHETELATNLYWGQGKGGVREMAVGRRAMALTRDRSKAAACASGDKIRELRQRLKRTLEDTATAAGISTPFLSQVEREFASPSLTSLAGIANALGISMQHVVDAPLDESTVCRSGELRFFQFAGSTDLFARFSCASRGRQLEAILVRISKGQTPTTPHSWSNTGNEEAVVLLVGTPAVL